MEQITQAQYNTAKQTYRNLHLKVNLLNFDYQTISSFEGNLISGSLASDSNSNMRNTIDVSLVVTDSSFNIAAEGKIWLDRLIQVYIGVDDMRTGETIWMNKGIYLINQPTYTYDAANNTLSFQGVDLMGLMTGLRGGMLTATYLIKQGENVRDVIIAILKENKFDKYVVSECQNTDGTVQSIPYEMQFDQGSTWWDVLEKILNILPNYQMYFDANGVFHYEPIPYKSNEPIRMDDSIWKENVTDESIQYDFESVKNSVRVLGRTHEINNYPSKIEISGTTLNLTMASWDSIYDNVMFGFTPTADVSGSSIRININSLGAKQLVLDKDKPVTALSKDVYYVAYYKKDIDQFIFMGHHQAQGEYKDTNTNSPFYIGNPAGEIKIVLFGDEYDNIMTDGLAKQRAKWEIYQRCRLNDTVQLTTVPIYWVEVNWMVEYTPLGGNTPNQYLISSVHTELSPEGKQTYELVKFYPYYE